MPPIPLSLSLFLSLLLTLTSLRSYHTSAVQAEHGATAASRFQHPCLPDKRCGHFAQRGIEIYPPSGYALIQSQRFWGPWVVLQGYPDKQFRDYIVRGSFRIAFDHSRAAHLTSKSRNMASAYEHAEVIETYLTNEVQLGHIGMLFRRCT